MDIILSFFVTDKKLTTNKVKKSFDLLKKSFKMCCDITLVS